MGVTLLTTQDDKRKGFPINQNTFKANNKRQKPIQDSPKEDHILCPSCESKIGLMERYFANSFYSVFEHKDQWNSIPEMNSSEGYKTKHINDVDYEKVKLMIYSMAFRASISSLEYFLDLKIKESTQERLRRILNSETAFEDFPITIITPKSDFDKTRNYIYANSNGFGECMLWANELLIFVNFENIDNELNRYFQDATSENGRIIVGIITEQSWDSLRKMVLHQKYKGR
jgi:hypothetical protein